MTSSSLEPALLEQLRQLSTCVASSAIETFGVRLPNVGFADSRVRSMFPELPAIVGYAATARVRSAAPPMEGGTYYLHTDWWNAILAVPSPRIAVIQDADEPPGLGGFVGEVHANILRALDCNGLVTNGAVRDLHKVRAIPFSMFAGNVSVSHAYAHVSGFGQPVEVGGLEIVPGDLLLADQHGVLSIPREIAARIPQVAEQIEERRRCLVELCNRQDFQPEMLDEACKTLGIMKQEAGEMLKNGSKGGRS
jgi:4-hydroxy-4-methyl-2-oxoglutarate aldolase